MRCPETSLPPVEYKVLANGNRTIKISGCISDPILQETKQTKKKKD